LKSLGDAAAIHGTEGRLDADPATGVASVALRGFLCRGGANASPPHELTSIMDHLTESSVD
jgi:hypothetical protein